MLKSESLDFHSHLPPYRSLLSPNARYDYQTHSLIPISETELTEIHRGRGNSKASNKIKMKYKSLLSDVSRKTSILSLRIGSASTIPRTLPVVTFSTLPVEVIDRILQFLDLEDHKACMYVNKQLYRLTKPHLYRRVKITSSYRLAQFVTYLRLNPSVGKYVRELDLSGMKSGVGDSGGDDVFAIFAPGDQELSASEVLAGWRDWKFQKNPLYSLHSHSNSSLWKVNSNSVNLTTAKTVHSRRTSTSSQSNSGKFRKLSNSLKYFKPKKGLSSDTRKRKLPPINQTLELRVEGPPKCQHPTINRFLFEYATLRDIPVGYIIHIVNFCPNLVSLNLANISLSPDYEISASMIYKYQTVDLMNNYSKDMMPLIDDMMTVPDSFLVRNDFDKPSDLESIISLLSSTSGTPTNASMKLPMELVNHPKAAPPGWRYNSLLPPIVQTGHDSLYKKKGDGKVFLSDLNLKAINNGYLTPIYEYEILTAISSKYALHKSKQHGIQYVNISSMVWIDLGKVRPFLNALLGSETEKLMTSPDDSDVLVASEDQYRRNLVIDLSNSGMYKVLQWAKVIDFSQPDGVRLAKKIINGESLDVLEESISRERARRGRIAENYLG